MKRFVSFIVLVSAYFRIADKKAERNQERD